MNTIVWVLVVLGHASTWSVGPEFSSKEKCEVAAVALYKAVDDARPAMTTKKPMCVRIEK
jgi:hypothetical protein